MKIERKVNNEIRKRRKNMREEKKKETNKLAQKERDYEIENRKKGTEEKREK